MSENILYYGDNLKVLRDHIADNSIDLIYLAPPFNSKVTYNVLFREPDGAPSEAQIAAFDDTWHWSEDAGKGFYRSQTWEKDYARIQIITIEELLSGKQPKIPPTLPTHKRAEKAETALQHDLLIE